MPGIWKAACSGATDEVEMQKVNPGWQFKATRW